MAIGLAILGLWAAQASAAPAAVVLGIAQDGGVPHLGCRDALCARARQRPRQRLHVASLGLSDPASGQAFLIDATPDMVWQIERLNHGRRGIPPRRPVDGILLTHAHIGHYAGLIHLGREVLGADRVPVYVTPKMAAFLRQNGPWSQLVTLAQIEIHEIEPGVTFALSPQLRATALRVPHRDEFSDTVGFRIEGPRRSLLYIPDIDKWERWDHRLLDEVAGCDHALVDGTFYAASELPGRTLAEIPHPLIGETLALLAERSALRSRLRFIHINHTNRLLWDRSARRLLRRNGAALAREGDRIAL